MKLSRLTKASDYEVRDWLDEKLSLTDYQKEIIYNREIIRFSPFEFYKKSNKKSNLLWRLTLPFYGLYHILLFVGLPINFMITGKWGYGDKFYSFYQKWSNKLSI